MSKIEPTANLESTSILSYEAPPIDQSRIWERRFRRLLAVPELGIALVIAILFGIFYLINPAILTAASMATLFRAIAFAGIIAIGQTMLLIAGELDISVGSVAGLCAIIAGYLMKEMHWPVALGVLAALSAGAMIGLINGLLAVKIGIPAFIVTLGMLYIAKGVDYLICAGYPIYPLPHSIVVFGKAQPLGISWAFLIFVVLAVLFQLLLTKTIWGRAIFATGGNAEVANVAGIRTQRVKIACFITTSVLAALAGVLVMAQLSSGQPEIGQGWELEVIASVVIGGVSLFGGIGSITGAGLGLFLMQLVRSGLAISKANPQWQTIAIGVIMIGAVGLDLLRRRARIME